MRIDEQALRAGDAAPRCPVSGLGAEFNPFIDPYLADPYPFWERARAAEPVFFSPELNYWVVTRYEDIRSVFADPKTFSASNAQTPIQPIAPEVIEYLKAGGLKTRPVISNSDPPEHTRVRKFIWQAFTPKRVADLEPAVRSIVGGFIDRIEGERRIDLVKAMFYDLPVHVLFLFLGMREDEIPKVKSWAHNRLMLTWGRLTPEQQMVEARGMLAFWKYTEAYVHSLLSNPPDNYVGDLLRVHLNDHGDLTLNEIENVVFGLLIAGHETTTSMSGNAVRTLLTRRAHWDDLCARPEIIPDAVEELMRFDTSVVAWRRKTTKAVQLSGVEIPQGADLLLALCSGNRDDRHFDRPDDLNFARENVRSHLSFGFGIHYCLGAPLARLELKVILEELTRRLPGMRLAPDQTWRFSPNTSFRGPMELWVEI